MPKGYTDWGVVTQSYGDYNQDNAELAARIGSDYRYSRSGKVLLSSNFIHDFRLWTQPLFSATFRGNPYLLDGIFRPGCLRFSSTIAGSFATYIRRRVPYLAVSNYGMEVIYKNIADLQYIEMTLVFQSEPNSLTFTVRLNTQTGVIYVYTSGSIIVQVGVFDNYVANSTEWNLFKMVVDPVNRRYLSARFNQTLFDNISPVGNYQQGGATNAFVMSQMDIQTIGSVNTDVRIGMINITFDEP